MKPLKQKKIKFQNECNCMVDFDLLEKAMIWYSPDYLVSRRKIFMYGRYPGVSIYDIKIHVHRLIGMYLNKEKICRSIVVHHKDGDLLNCKKENLELMSSRIHASHHNKGKKLSESHKRKIAAANRRRKGMIMKRKYNIPLNELQSLLKKGMSINKIAKHYGCDWSIVKSRIKETPELLE